MLVVYFINCCLRRGLPGPLFPVALSGKLLWQRLIKQKYRSSALFVLKRDGVRQNLGRCFTKPGITGKFTSKTPRKLL